MTKEEFNKKNRTEKVKFLCSKRVIPIVEVSTCDWGGSFVYDPNIMIPMRGQVLDLVGDYFDIECDLKLKHKECESHLSKINDFISLLQSKTYFEALDESIKMAYYLYENKILFIPQSEIDKE